MDTLDFYKPVIEGIQIDTMVSKRLLVELKLELINRNTIRCLFMIFKKLNLLQSQGYSVKVTWYIKADEDFILETGMDFQELTEIDFEFLLY